MIQTRERADGVAGVSPHAELVNAPDVDGDSHELSVNRASNLGRISPTDSQADQGRGANLRGLKSSLGFQIS